ncbi:MAG: glutathione S-transferase family protein [Rhodospirillaceae bacterium]
MEIYGAIFSPYCARVALAARFKGVKLKFKPTPGGGYKSPEYLKLNPLGKVPAVKDGKMVIYESGIIVEYLDAKHKKKPVVPKNAKAAAQARMVASVVGDYVHGAVSKLFALMGPSPDKAAVAAVFAEVDKYLDIAEQVIAAKPFAAGAKFTIADVYALPSLQFASLFMPVFGAAKPLGARKKLNAYMAKAKKHKIMGSVLKDMEEGFRAWQKSRA